MKNAIITIALIVCGISFGVAYYQNKISDESKDALNRERYSRMVAEESLLKANEKINSLEKQLSSIQNQLAKSDKLLKQTLSLRDNLQKKLDETVAQKETLEQKVKDLSIRTGTSASSTGDI